MGCSIRVRYSSSVRQNGFQAVVQTRRVKGQFRGHRLPSRFHEQCIGRERLVVRPLRLCPAGYNNPLLEASDQRKRVNGIAVVPSLVRVRGSRQVYRIMQVRAAPPFDQRSHAMPLLDPVAFLKASPWLGMPERVLSLAIVDDNPAVCAGMFDVENFSRNRGEDHRSRGRCDVDTGVKVTLAVETPPPEITGQNPLHCGVEQGQFPAPRLLDKILGDVIGSEFWVERQVAGHGLLSPCHLQIQRGQATTFGVINLFETAHLYPPLERPRILSGVNRATGG